MIVYDERINPCPICGGECYYEWKEDVLLVIKIRCEKCGLTGHKIFARTAPDPVGATIDYWNNRT